MKKTKSSIVAITKNKLRLVYQDKIIKLFWDDSELSFKSGINAAINTAGIWTDSSFGDWEIVRRAEDFFVLKNVWHQLPIICIWKFRMDKNGYIQWTVHMEVQEFLEIDERRIAMLVSPLYKSWINSYEGGRFPQVIGWQDMPLENFSSRLVGVRHSKDNVIPPLVLEFDENKPGKASPLIQNTSTEIGSHLIGVNFNYSPDKKCYREGTYEFFSGRLYVCNDEDDLNTRIQERKRAPLDNIRGKVKGGDLNVLLANMSWQRQDMNGVRAGSRWPHIKDESEGNYLPFPFFLAYSTSLLRKNDIRADMVDFTAEETSEDDFLKGLSKRNFDIFVTETSTPSFYYDMELLKKVAFSLEVPIVLCGCHPEIYKPDFLEKFNFIDFVLFGEYEFTLLELIKSIIKGERVFSSIDGLIWRDSCNNVIKNKPRKIFDINMLPWPYRDDLPMEKYWDLPGDIPSPSAQMVASRGCPFSCNFCLWPQALFGGSTYRARDVKDVVDEMEDLIRKKGFKSIYFDDDTFNVGKKRMLEFCEEVVKRSLNNVPWAIMARADLMDEEILDSMKKAGLHAVKYGVESASQKIVDRCGKKLDLEKTEKMIKYTKSLDIKVHLTFTFGLPGETKKTIKKSIKYALKLDPISIQFSIITPFPGTKLFEELNKEGRILTKNWSLYDGHYSCIFQPENLLTEDLEEAKRYAYRLWADHQRKRRGLTGNIKRFLEYQKKNGFNEAITKTGDYIYYLLFKRRKFMGGA